MKSIINKPKRKVVCVSGYFNPIHHGHIHLLNEAKALGDFLIVILNTDKQVKLKGSVPFLKENERRYILKNIKTVDDVFFARDTDKTVCKTLEIIKPDIFANGGDRKNIKDIPETKVCLELDIEIVFNVGGGKIESSSEIIKRIKNASK